jgi:tRNA-specific 2-thiouridylase
MSTKPERVVIAMSGGVDSSVAAALLVQQGFEVIGMMLRLWSENGKEASNRCCAPDAMASARRVAALLGIPFFVIDARQAFREQVVQYFIDGHLSGVTPNPCLICNRQIRWGFLLEHALAMQAGHLATGHYARLRSPQDGRIQLLRAIDRDKDQSYVLYLLDQEQLRHTLFPLGELTKQQVRQLAQELNLPIAHRPESQDLCFLGHEDYRQFLARNAPHTVHPGPILNRSGEVIGEHQGLAFYTIGQRKGMGIAAPQPLYVLDKDPTRNALIVGFKEELGKSELIASPVHWISGSTPTQPFRAQVKIRYKAKEVEATVIPMESAKVKVVFDESLRDITPGQAAVFYQDEVCLGGGIIQE